MIAAAAIPARNVDALATYLTSPATGIVRRLGLHPGMPGAAGFHAGYAELADARRLGCCGEIQTPGGSGFTVEEAVTRTLFEAVERYCGAFADRDKAVWGSPAGPAFLHGDDLPLYTDAQYRQPGWPYAPLRSDSRLWWTPAVCLHSGETRYIPSSLVYVPYSPKHRDECLGPSLSTGMAASWSWEEACLSGLYEICERDAFATMWSKRTVGPRLTPAPQSLLHFETAQVAASGLAAVTFVDISNDLRVPTVLAVLRHCFHGRRVVSIGASAKPDWEAAGRKALAEAVSIQSALNEFLNGPDADWAPLADFSNVTDWKWHALLYTRPEFQPELDFITSAAETRTIAEPTGPAAGLRTLLDSLRPHFPQILAVDLTTPELAEIPVRAVKVVAPHALPVEPDHRYRRQALRRLEGELPRNPLPHPFL